MTDHQTHSQIPDDAGKPPEDGWDGEPTLTDSEGNLWHLDDEALHPLYRAENLDGPSLPLYVITQMVGPMSVPPATGEQP